MTEDLCSQSPFKKLIVAGSGFTVRFCYVCAMKIKPGDVFVPVTDDPKGRNGNYHCACYLYYIRPPGAASA